MQNFVFYDLIQGLELESDRRLYVLRVLSLGNFDNNDINGNMKDVKEN